ncbi:MAG: 1-acyl-sn-glycerol-3-phosphate acyltransferase [Bacteroidales bacterium]|nr:1-acyl-sn-glycerol-3-phosphate acyltransferase [Bacteroidales bacterium]
MGILKSVLVWIMALAYIVIFFPLTFIAWLLLLPIDRERTATHWLLVWQSYLLAMVLPAWKVEISGLERISGDTTYVIISNHQSMLDIIFLNCIRQRYKWISKIENERVPFIGWYLKMAKYITVNRGDDDSKAKMLDDSLACLKRGISIMIFPEGTRSRDGRIGFFKRGAFQLAMQAGVPLLPVLIDGTGEILPKHGLILGSGYRIRIRVYDPLMPGQFMTDDPDALALRIQEFYREELEKTRAGKH